MSLICRRAVNMPRFNYRLVFRHFVSRTTTSSTLESSLYSGKHSRFASNPSKNPRFSNPNFVFQRFIHSTQESTQSSSATSEKLDSDEADDEDGTMNEFLSRFVWIMRKKLLEEFQCDKQTLDGMLLIIVEKVVSEMEQGSVEQMLETSMASPSQELSEDLWKIVWEVSNMVLADMKKAANKDKMKKFSLSEDVQEMCRFAGEVGIRGDLLKELRFKWAREKMEESEFYENLQRLREQAAREEVEERGEENSTMDGEVVEGEEKSKAVSLPKRKGKIRYKIYGLDLSHPKWVEVVDKIHDSGEVLWPQEPKSISGKCKLVTERILSLNEDDDPSSYLVEWIELLQPTKVDWIALLDRLKEKNMGFYLKVAELVLNEESFNTNIRDYSKLIDIHAKENRLEDVERILKKMNEKGIDPDVLTVNILVHMYSKAGHLDRAKAALDHLKSQGFQPDEKVYESMIMAYLDARKPKSAELLMREMEARDIKPTREMYMALLRSFSQGGDVSGAARMATTMQFSGIQPSLESCTLLVEAYAQAGNPDQARNNFDYLIKIGHRPDDRITSSMIKAYEKKNMLDKALQLLLELEKQGFEPGIATYSVLVDWLGQLQLVDEVEQLLGKIAELGEAPPLELHVSLCTMYLKAGNEKKGLQALGIVEAKKEQLKCESFERIIVGLAEGGFVKEAQRVSRLMEEQGYTGSEKTKVALAGSQITFMGSQASGRRRSIF